ncbi:di-N-acetylchitobiase-like [Periplaneta americana]|uniref:di-N-acetylchitobiase-like n=1 Tax=Periplaneta americana TaxID=6978 RepID=UPI0037E84069
MYFKLLTVLLLIKPLTSQCPCEDEALCQPVSSTPNREVFAFMNGCEKNIWETFDWNKLTTLAVSSCFVPELVCFAHYHNVRVVPFGTLPDEYLLNETLRMQWIEEKLSLAQEHYLDGFNIDFESEIPRGDPKAAGLTALAAEMTLKFHQAIPFSQVTIDVAWSPSGIDGRWYDYVGLSNAVDYLFVMAYDEQSQIFDDECTALANSGLTKTDAGLLQYMEVGIPASKLVLGVPWYGYDYECIEHENQTCFIEEVPFRGANCSDAAGRQIRYSTIVEQMLPNATGGRQWDYQEKSPYFYMMDQATGKMHQIWYDDPESLRTKFELVEQYGLRGAGMWSAEQVDYSNTTEGQTQRNEMWGAFPSPTGVHYHILVV